MTSFGRFQFELWNNKKKYIKVRAKIYLRLFDTDAKSDIRKVTFHIII